MYVNGINLPSAFLYLNVPVFHYQLSLSVQQMSPGCSLYRFGSCCSLAPLKLYQMTSSATMKADGRLNIDKAEEGLILLIHTHSLN